MCFMLNYIKNFFSTNIFFLILLIIVVFSLYGKSINFELLKFDDDILITSNINLISDYKNIPKLFMMSAFYDNTTTYYRPVLSLSFAIESFFVRDDLRLYHITNIILFILSLYFFYLFCVDFKLNSTIAKFVILIIAVHPMFSSVVVWIPGRNDSLLAFLFLLSFLCFIKYINTRKIRYILLFYFFFVLSIFTKENFLFLIPLYFVYLFLYEYNISKKKLAIFFASLIPFILLFLILRNNSVASLSFKYYVLHINNIFFNFIKDSCIYFYNFFIPEYIPTILIDAKVSFKIIIYNCLFIVLFLFMLYKKILSNKIIIFSLLLILLSLFPTFLTKDNTYLNHRFFICSLSFVMIIISLVDYLIVKIDRIKIVLIIFFIISFIGLFNISYKQADKYKDHDTFWINAYVDNPNCYATCLHLSYMYLKIGRLEEASYYAKKVIELKSTFLTLINYAKFLIMIGDLEQAKTALLKLDQDMEKGSKDLIYYPLSEIYYQYKNYEQAFEYALKAHDMVPYNIDYCIQLIKIYDVMENYNEEMKIYEYLLSFDNKNKEYKNKIEELKQKMMDKDKINA